MAKTQPTLFDQWFQRQNHTHSSYKFVVLNEITAHKTKVAQELFDTMRTYYATPDTLDRLKKKFSKSKILKFWGHKLPKTLKQRSGDLGEILAAEYAVKVLKYDVPIKKLRWKDGRDNSMRGDDITAVRKLTKKLLFLKGEVKSRAKLSDSTMQELARGLKKDSGLPNSHTLSFIAERLAEAKPVPPETQELIDLLLDAEINGVTAASVKHLAFTVSGNKPVNYIKDYLTIHCMKGIDQVVASIVLDDHAGTITAIYAGLNSASTL